METTTALQSGPQHTKTKNRLNSWRVLNFDRDPPLLIVCSFLPGFTFGFCILYFIKHWNFFSCFASLKPTFFFNFVKVSSIMCLTLRSAIRFNYRLCFTGLLKVDWMLKRERTKFTKKHRIKKEKENVSNL